MIGEEPGTALFGRVADHILAGAESHGANDFKIPLFRRTLIACLTALVGEAA
jgi:xanthine dehydrogenase YagS FAD-binding subunit